MKKKYLLLVLALILAPFSLSQEEGGGEETPPAEEVPPEEPPADEGPPPEPPPAPEGPPPIEVPPGCEKVQTPTGMFEIECNIEQEHQQEFEDFSVDEEIEDCDGTFRMVEGNPTCTVEGENGFTGIVCPTQEQLNSMMSQCGGEVETFQDELGCTAVRCMNNDFKEGYDQKIDELYGDDPLKVAALQCQKDGGEAVVIEGQIQCINHFKETIEVPDEFGAITQQDIENAADKLEKIENSLGPITEKLNEMSPDAEVFGEGAQKLEEVQKTIEALKEGLEDSDTLTEEQRINIFKDIKGVMKTVKAVTTGIVTGEIITDEEELRRQFEEMDEWYGRPFSPEDLEQWKQAEMDALEKVHNCGQFTEGTSFVPPDPEGMVVLVELLPQEGNCRMLLNLAAGPTAEYVLSEDIYTTFRGPKEFADLTCSGEGCAFMENIISMTHGTTPEEICVEECVERDCDLGMFACMEQNLTDCELECGLREEGQGPFGPGGEFDPSQACIAMCVGPEIQCEPGGTNPTCLACEEQCMAQYGPGLGYEHCLTGDQYDAKEAECIAQGKYGEPVESPTPDGGSCLSGVICQEYPDFGPEGGGPPTGQTILGGISNIINWIGGLFK